MGGPRSSLHDVMLAVEKVRYHESAMAWTQQEGEMYLYKQDRAPLV